MSDRRVTMGRGTALAAAAACLLAGAALAVLLVRAGADAERPAEVPETVAPRPPDSGVPSPSDASAAGGPPGAPLPDLEVRLTEEAAARVGIEVAPVTRSTATSGVRIPGTIQANAYKQVAVTPLVGGRVTRINAELGDTVRRGATLAVIYSPDLATAQTTFLSRRAELEALTQELQRTERLVEIGAASRQELERIRASHTSAATAVASARSQLVLLGMAPRAIDAMTSGKEVSATTSVPAPISGVVTERDANPGLNVDPSTVLFTVVDLSSVWVVGDLYERDFPHVRVGSPATVTTTAYPDLALSGRVTYIDPQLNEQTRTAQVRVEVPNPRGELRLGMYAEIRIQTAAEDAPAGGVVTVPREAVQTIGTRQFVYLASPGEPGRYVEREVRVAGTNPDGLEIASGLSPGDVIVTTGSFFVRSERERLGLRQRGSPAPAPAPAASDPLTVAITDKGFEPARLTVEAGKPVRITFVRRTENTCATEIVFPSLKLKKPLPLNEPVVVELTPDETGEIAFTCGMDMLRGAVVAR